MCLKEVKKRRWPFRWRPSAECGGTSRGLPARGSYDGWEELDGKELGQSDHETYWGLDISLEVTQSPRQRRHGITRYLGNPSARTARVCAKYRSRSLRPGGEGHIRRSGLFQHYRQTTRWRLEVQAERREHGHESSISDFRPPSPSPAPLTLSFRGQEARCSPSQYLLFSAHCSTVHVCHLFASDNFTPLRAPLCAEFYIVLHACTNILVYALGYRRRAGRYGYISAWRLWHSFDAGWC